MDYENRDLPLNEQHPEENNDNVPNNNTIKIIIKDLQGEVKEMFLTKDNTVKSLVTEYRKSKTLPMGCKVLLYFNGKQLKEENKIEDLSDSKEIVLNCVIRLRGGKKLKIKITK